MIILIVIRYYYLQMVTHMFIGRKAELEFLASRYNSKSAQLVVLYGRRRVGKTETLREFCKDKPHVFYSCRECTDEEQLKSFSQRMLKPNINASKYINKFTDWEQAFSQHYTVAGRLQKVAYNRRVSLYGKK